MTEAEDSTQLLTVLASRKTDWAATPLEDKYQAALEIRSRVLEGAARWARAAAEIRGATKEAIAAQELPLLLVPVANYLDGLLGTLDALKKGAPPPSPPITGKDGEGRAVVRAHPWGRLQTWLSLLGWSTSTDLTLGPQGADQRCGAHTAAAPSPGQAVLVHSVGYEPVEALAAVLYLAFVENCVVALTLPAWQAPLQVVLEYILDPLARGAFFASLLVADGADPGQGRGDTAPTTTDWEAVAGAELAGHPSLDRLHVVGHTPATLGALRAATPGGGPRQLSGDVHGPCPWVVAPGPWTRGQLAHHSQLLTEGLAYAGSATSLAPRLVFLPAAWEHTDTFITLVKEELQDYKLPAALGNAGAAAARHAAFLAAYPASTTVTSPGPRSDLIPPEAQVCQPWAINVLETYPAQAAQEPAFKEDPRCPVITFVKIATAEGTSEGELLEEYLGKAIAAVNDDVAGSFGLTLVTHPATDKAHGSAVAAAVDAARYGVVCVNAGVPLALWSAQTHWGVFGGAGAELPAGAGARLGSVADCLMYGGTVKGVVRFPFETYLHTLPPGYRPMSLKTARILAVGIVDGVRGFMRSLSDRSTGPVAAPDPAGRAQAQAST